MAWIMSGLCHADASVPDAAGTIKIDASLYKIWEYALLRQKKTLLSHLCAHRRVAYDEEHIVAPYIPKRRLELKTLRVDKTGEWVKEE